MSTLVIPTSHKLSNTAAPKQSRGISAGIEAFIGIVTLTTLVAMALHLWRRQGGTRVTYKVSADKTEKYTHESGGSPFYEIH